ncbi:MAG: O-sialoglycoprotein endopeptidase [Firmicutes bacterium]|nr:O-sialoglycoprotein endopeptidase [Bacillota bacterium]
MKALAIDTSNYMTSVALVSGEGKVLKDLRSPVPVAQGEKGLRQSEALFHHIRNLPPLLEETLAEPLSDLEAVVVSSRPRPLPESYMPVFLAGVGQARSLAAALRVPCLERSHQEGHVYAALASSSLLPVPECFLTVHLSGGTSELLLVKREETAASGLKIEMLGQATDLNAGQFVDRVGVALGLPFPAGPALEELAQGARGVLRLSTRLIGLNPSFSGPTTQALRLIEEGCDPKEVALAVQNAISKVLEKWLLKAQKVTGVNQVLLSGGVTANRYIRRRLVDRLAKRGTGLRAYFGQAAYSGDNAVGLAVSYWFPNLPTISAD